MAASHSHNHQHCISDALANAEAVCNENGARFTDIRKRIFELVWASHKPVGAYTLLDQIRDESFSAKPPTVYRALDFLMEYGLIHKIESLNAYIGCSLHDGHHDGIFFICQTCENVQEIDATSIRSAIAQAAQDKRFQINKQMLEVEGTCESCLPHA